MACDNMSHSYPDFHKPFIINEKNMASAIPSRAMYWRPGLMEIPLAIPDPEYLVMVSAVVGLASPGWDNVP
jgi:hypothetical protein